MQGIERKAARNRKGEEAKRTQGKARGRTRGRRQGKEGAGGRRGVMPLQGEDGPGREVLQGKAQKHRIRAAAGSDRNNFASHNC